MATTIERAKAWLSRVPHSISGQNGHAQAFTAATGLIHGFCLDDNDAYDLLLDWNRSCQPPWKERELVHKIRSARDTPHSNPRGHLLEASGPRTAPPPMSAVRFTKQAAAPAPLAPIADEFNAFLQAAFCEGEIVCICNDLTPEGKPNSKSISDALKALGNPFADR